MDEVRKEMILVFKVNDFLKNIHERIGNPLNNFNILLDYVYKVVMKDMKVNGYSLSLHFKIFHEYYSFKFLVFFVNIYFKCFNNSHKDINKELVDLEVI